jgi:hypothetical protein
MREGRDTSVCLLNYRKDGTPYFNKIFIAGIKDASGKIVSCVGVQVELKVSLDQSKSDSEAEEFSRVDKPIKS